MPNLGIYVNDDLWHSARQVGLPPEGVYGARSGGSALVTAALRLYVEQGGRPARSGRGALETLRAIRTARLALDTLEATLVQGRPVRPRLRRYHRGARP